MQTDQVYSQPETEFCIFHVTIKSMNKCKVIQNDYKKCAGQRPHKNAIIISDKRIKQNKSVKFKYDSKEVQSIFSNDASYAPKRRKLKRK